jgi:regulator of sigma E protease
MPILETILLSVLPFLIVIGLVITVHELGHYLAGRAVRAKIDRFAIGFGRALLSWRGKTGIEYRIAWIPIGGYVRFAGDENMASIPDAESLDDLRRHLVRTEGPEAVKDYFHFKPLWQRTIIIAAGPVANFLLAIAIFTGLLLAFGERLDSTRVDIVQPGSAAAAAGFQVGDVVTEANGKPLKSFDDLKRLVILSSDTAIAFTVERGGRPVALTATPRRTPMKDPLGHVQRLGSLGIQHNDRPGDVNVKRYSLPGAVVRGVQQTYETVETTVIYVGRMIGGKETAEQLSGPLGMAQLSGDLAKRTAANSQSLGDFAFTGGLTMLQLIAAISVGIGFMNLLPVPVLDGGHLLFYAYEALARRPLAAKVQAAGYRVGLALVLGLMLFATWNDLQRLRVFNLVNRLFS